MLNSYDVDKLIETIDKNIDNNNVSHAHWVAGLEARYAKVG